MVRHYLSKIEVELKAVCCMIDDARWCWVYGPQLAIAVWC